MKHFSPPSPHGAIIDCARSAVLESPPAERLVIALVGLAFEGRIAAGPSVLVVCRNHEGEVAASLDLAIKRGCRGVISFGVAGGLAPHLRPGNWIVASSIIDGEKIRATDQVWSGKIMQMIPGASHAPIVGVDAAVTDPEVKRQMHVGTGAAAVDMESHHVARLAEAHGLSFAAVRVVIDPAHRAVPGAALAGMRPGGGTSMMAVVRELAVRPWQLPGLLRLAFDGYTARRALLRARPMLGPGFGILDLGASDLAASAAPA